MTKAEKSRRSDLAYGILLKLVEANPGEFRIVDMAEEAFNRADAFLAAETAEPLDYKRRGDDDE